MATMYRYLTLLPVPWLTNGTIPCKGSLIGDSNSNLYWDIQLDPDLLQTLINIYPEWFQEYNFNLMGEEGISFPLLNQDKPLDSSPQAEVDNASIRNSIDKNKESLKLKLMLRRPIHQLVEQGIIPPPKQSPGFYEQSKKLERARMEDFLKHKIQRRPDRQVLIQQHILEDTTVSPTIHSKQRQLKKARLTDDLNDRLSHRPGPLELIKGNILLTDGKFAQAVKEGQIQFKATSEGEPIKHPPPRFIIEEETSSDDAASPSQSRQSEKSLEFTNSDSGPPSIQAATISSTATLTNIDLSTAANPASNNTTQGNTLSLAQVTSLIQQQQQQQQQAATSNLETQTFALGTFNCIPLTTTPATSTLSTVFPTFTTVTTTSASNQCITGNAATVSLSSPLSTSSSSSVTSVSTTCSQGTSNKESAPILTKNRKKSKSKSQPKTKTIKFHEYKGPPNAQKNQSSSNSTTESSYELLLKQQQLFLQWQLEWQNKYPQIILPSAQKNNMDQGSGSNGHVSNNSVNSNSTINNSNININSNNNTCIIGNTNSASININSISNGNNNNCNSNLTGSTSNNNQANSVTPIIIAPQTGTEIGTNQTIVSNNITTVSNSGNNAGSNGVNSLLGTTKVILKLEDMKVSDLKTELKKRNLPVSGSKPQLIERLRPFIDSSMSTSTETSSLISVCRNDVNGKTDDPMSPNMMIETDSDKASGAAKNSPSSTPMELDSTNLSDTNEELQRIQHKKMEELKRTVCIQQQQQQSLQPPQFQLQFNNQPVFTNQTQSVTIPLSALTSPQIQIVTTSSAPMADAINSNDSKSFQKHILQSNQQKFTNQPSNQSPNLAAIISPGNASAAVKANLAAFLHQHAQQQQAQQQALQQQQIQIQQQQFQQVTGQPQTQTVNLINSIPVATAELPRTETSFDQQPTSLLLGKMCDAHYHQPNETTAFTTSDTPTTFQVTTADASNKYHLAIKQSTFSLPLLTTQVIDSKSFPTFQQVLLYPSSLNTSSQAPKFQTTSVPVTSTTTLNVSRIKQTRTNSLPTELTTKSVSQRTASLPDFSTLVNITTDTCLDNGKGSNLLHSQQPQKQQTIQQIQTQSPVEKPPPAYEEATKKICHSKEETKKMNQNQAIDDVLEILMKSGDLSMTVKEEEKKSAIEHEASSPSPSSLFLSNPPSSLHSQVEQNMDCSTISALKDISEENDVDKMDDNNLENFFNKSLEEIANTVCMSSLTTEQVKTVSSVKDSNDCDVTMDLNVKKSKEDESNRQQCNENYDVTGGDLLFNDLMDFQGSPMNVDYANWLAEIMPDNNPFKTSNQSSASTSLCNNNDAINNNNNNDNIKYETNNNAINSSAINNNNNCNKTYSINYSPGIKHDSRSFASGSFSSSSSSSSSSTSTDHDPVLANNMVESCHYGDPMIDLYFDMESDCKETNDCLANLGWDKVDFAT